MFQSDAGVFRRFLIANNEQQNVINPIVSYCIPQVNQPHSLAKPKALSVSLCVSVLFLVEPASGFLGYYWYYDRQNTTYGYIYKKNMHGIGTVILYVKTQLLHLTESNVI